MDDGRLWITFNGEVYNVGELRADWRCSAIAFAVTPTPRLLSRPMTSGDSRRFNASRGRSDWGMRRAAGWLVRDRVGKNPRYYAQLDGTPRVASELKAIVADPAFPRDIDAAAVRLYLRFEYAPSPLTIYRHERKLPPRTISSAAGASPFSTIPAPVSFTTLQSLMSDAEGKRSRESGRQCNLHRVIADCPRLSPPAATTPRAVVDAGAEPRPVRTFSTRFTNAQFNEGTMPH